MRPAHNRTTAAILHNYRPLLSAYIVKFGVRHLPANPAQSVRIFSLTVPVYTSISTSSRSSSNTLSTAFSSTSSSTIS